MNASPDELPRAPNGRRLATGVRAITLRIGVRDASQREAVTSSVQSAAESSAADLGGSVVQDARGFIIALPPIDPRLNDIDNLLSGAMSTFPQLLCAGMMMMWLMM